MTDKEHLAEVESKLNEAIDLLLRWIEDRPYTTSEQKDLISDTESFLEEEGVEL